jgi:DNA-binding transcriptional ArsR family regulator
LQITGGASDTSKPRKAVHIIDNSESIRLLADFTRTEILRLLSKHLMTETQLAEQLGLTRAAVGYHLHLLLDAGLITVSKVEAEKHGILQKYYTPIAVLLIVDPEHIPKDVQRYFIRMEIEHLRGIFSALQLYHHVSKVSSRTLERLAEAMLKQLKIVGQKHVKDMASEDAELLKVKIYAEALANLTKQREWRSLFRG